MNRAGLSHANFRSASRNRRFSPLLLLPTELRVQIYEYVLGDKEIYLQLKYWNQPVSSSSIQTSVYTRPEPNGSHTLPKKKLNVKKNGGPKSHTFALLYVSRHIFLEAQSLPFQLNIFSLGSKRTLTTWLAHREPQMREIRTLRLHTFNALLQTIDGEEIALEPLGKLTKLRSIEVCVSLRRCIAAHTYMAMPWGRPAYEEDPSITAKNEQDLEKQIKEVCAEGVQVTFRRLRAAT
jgi:hypothetical protein